MGHWEEIDHTADIAIRVSGDTLADLFSTSASAMFALVAKPEACAPSVFADVRLEAIDRESLLVDWLNELLYLHERDEIVIVDIIFDQLTYTELQARVRGLPVSVYQTSIKAATFHNLEIERYQEEYRTTIVFDI
jgi:SHS2 domain-containing protein